MQWRSRGVSDEVSSRFFDSVRRAEALVPEEALDSFLSRVADRIVLQSERTLTTRVMPSQVTIVVSPEMAKRLNSAWNDVTAELSNYVETYARDEGYRASGTSFALAENSHFHRRRFSVLLNAQEVPSSAKVRREPARASGQSTMVVGRVRWEVTRPDGKSLALLDGKDFLIGASSECDLIINVPTVSRRHAHLTPAGDSITVTDLNSTNGTYVRGKKLTGPHKLSDGDEVVLAGEVSLRVTRTG
ncbi:hypothetical protein GCM10011410_03030 [Hoyosella rhizosphaerae]|uniref:FHA domain-containing protein n=1 Tax=Hoyosella rhizosphaerae TaxID=1755582 RepID=A0A916X890_9ACTN|nr:hypothetical protein GCM10011410_03030 [Hoyosella rhizosphaerae]